MDAIQRYEENMRRQNARAAEKMAGLMIAQPIQPEPKKEAFTPEQVAYITDLFTRSTDGSLQPGIMKRIAVEVAARHGISLPEMMSASRHKKLVKARQEAFYLCVKAGKSLPQVGKFFGGRDHTTVLHGVRRYEAHLKANGIVLSGLSRLSEAA